MDIDFLKRLLLFVGLLLAQVLVLNHIHLFGYATPLVYVYFVMGFRRGYPKWAILLWSFMLGLSVDTFSNTPGMAAASMTLIGLLQPYVLELFLQRDSDEDIQPTILNLGPTRYISLTLSLTFIYCLVFFTLEDFSFFDPLRWALCVVGSTLITELLNIVIDNLRRQ